MLARGVAVLMAFMLFFSVGLQYNDPDPIPWILLYGAAGLVTAVAAVLPGRYPWPLPAAVGATALVWAISIWPGLVPLPDLFASFEMDSDLVEEARESLGLAITAAWMAVLVAGRLIGRRRAQDTATIR